MKKLEKNWIDEKDLCDWRGGVQFCYSIFIFIYLFIFMFIFLFIKLVINTVGI